MSDFAARLEEACKVLKNDTYRPGEEFSELALQFGKEATLKTLQVLRTKLKSGVSEVEALAAFPFAIAFLVSIFAHCAEEDAGEAEVDRIMEASKKLARGLVRGTEIAPSRVPSVNYH
jgi:hypothetical protein